MKRTVRPRRAIFVLVASATSLNLLVLGFMFETKVRRTKNPFAISREKLAVVVDDESFTQRTTLWARVPPSSDDFGMPSTKPGRTVAASTATAMAASDLASFSPWEQWLVYQVKDTYDHALTIKCPFFRRRAADLLDASDMILRFIIYRHKSLPFSPPGWKCHNDNHPKQIGLSQLELLECIRQDWRTDTNKGYYVTGKVTTSIYRDDVVFDGPDPDMPVRGLRKYLNAASQLFEQSKSRSELISLEIVDGTSNSNKKINGGMDSVIVAKWKMQGVLRLPWKPTVPEWTGSTTYYTDQDGLIVRHEETWDKSVGRAFLETLWPAFASRIWQQHQPQGKDKDSNEGA